MPREPKNYDAELQVLMEKTRKVKTQKTTQFGELVQVTGADALPIKALAGVLLAAVEQGKKQPEAVARWTERGQAFFQGGSGGKRGGKAGAGEPAGGSASDNSTAPAPSGGA